MSFDTGADTEATALVRTSGVTDTIGRLSDALDDYQAALAAKRAAEENRKARKDQRDQALAQATWETSSRFATDGNKTYYQPDDGGDRRQVTAAERDSLKDQLARRTVDVVNAEKLLRNADAGAQQAADNVDVAGRRLAAVQHELHARTAVLQTLSTALIARETLR